MDTYKIVNKDGNDEIIYVPYNSRNVKITADDILNILGKRKIFIDKINNINIFVEAFTHKSYCKNEIYNQMILNKIKKGPHELELFNKSYERLEYLGDRLLKTIMGTYLFHRYETQNEGYMTRLQIKIEDKKNLALMSKELQLNNFLIISKKIENECGRNSDKLCEDIFESFIGALYLCNGIEEGFKLCTMLITNLLETVIDYSDKLYCDNNYKDRLMRVYHNLKWASPSYDVIYYEGTAQTRMYIMGVYSGDDKNKYIGIGKGGTKKSGEQVAAKIALIKLNELNTDQYTNEDLNTIKVYEDFYKVNSSKLQEWYKNYNLIYSYFNENHRSPTNDEIGKIYNKYNTLFESKKQLFKIKIIYEKWMTLLNTFTQYLDQDIIQDID